MASGVINNDRGIYAPNNINESMTAKEVCESVTTSGAFHLWANYNSVSYAPVQKTGNWIFRLFHPVSNPSHNYDIFEAFYHNDGEYYYYSYPRNKWYKVTSAAV